MLTNAAKAAPNGILRRSIFITCANSPCMLFWTRAAIKIIDIEKVVKVGGNKIQIASRYVPALANISACPSRCRKSPWISRATKNIIASMIVKVIKPPSASICKSDERAYWKFVSQWGDVLYEIDLTRAKRLPYMSIPTPKKAVRGSLSDSALASHDSCHGGKVARGCLKMLKATRTVARDTIPISVNL